MNFSNPPGIRPADIPHHWWKHRTELSKWFPSEHPCFASFNLDWHGYQIIRLGLGGNPVTAFGDLHIGYRFIHVAGMIRNIFSQLAVLIIDAITSMCVVIGVIADLVRIRGCIDSQPARRNIRCGFDGGRPDRIKRDGC